MPADLNPHGDYPLQAFVDRAQIDVTAEVDGRCYFSGYWVSAYTPRLPRLYVTDAPDVDEPKEEGDSAHLEFEVVLDRSEFLSDREVTVNYSTSSEDATAGSDYVARSGTLTFPATTSDGRQIEVVQVQVLDDPYSDPFELVYLTLRNPSDGEIREIDPRYDGVAVGRILNSELYAQFDSLPRSHDGTNPFTFLIDFDQDVTITAEDFRDHALVVTGGTATAAQKVDGRADLWELTIEPSWDWAVSLRLRARRSCTAQGALCTSDGQPLSVEVGWMVPGPVVTPTLNVADASATEGSAVAFTVSLSPARSDTVVTVAYATSGGTATSGTDFTAASGTLTFAANETSKTVSVATDDDSDYEYDETFTLTLSSPTNAMLRTWTVTGTINNDDDPVVSVADASATEGSAVGFTVSLSSARSETVTVAYATSGGTATSGTDFTAASGTLTFAANEMAKTVSVATTDDSVDEDDETFTLTLSSPTNATLGSSTATGTINDNDEAALSVADASATEGSAVEFTVTLSPTSSEQVTVAYATSGGTATSGTDFTAASGTLTFAANETSKTVSVATTDDSDDEENETFTLTLSSPTNAVLGNSTATGTINAPLTATFQNVPAEHDGSSSFTLRVSFSEDLAGGGSGRKLAQALTPTGATLGTVRRVDQRRDLYRFPVQPLGTDAVTVSLSETTDCEADDAVCTADGRALSQAVSVTVAGPDVTPTVSVAAASATEGDSVSFTVSLSPASSDTVTVAYATSGGTATSGTDFTAASGTLTFAANETSKTVSVATTDDSDDEEDETFTLTLSSPTNATLGDSTATGTINDDDAAALTAEFEQVPASHDGSTEFTLRLKFSEDITTSFRVLRDTAVSAANGTVRAAKRVDGRSDLWELKVEPSGDDDVTLSIGPSPTDCTADDAVCTSDNRALTGTATATVAGPDVTPTLSVAAASATEGDSVEFAVTLSDSTSEQVTVAYATSGGTATSGTDFTAASGTLTFAANETSKTVSVATADDSDDEENETFTLTLSGPTNATLGDSTATGTINDDDTPLTAEFGGMPESHDGSKFTFSLTFSEDVSGGHRAVRDAFDATGGSVTKAKRQTQGSDKDWTITVEPASASDTVAITLPETTDCTADDAICTQDDRKLSNSSTDTVAASITADMSGGNPVADALALASGLTPDDAAAALFGEQSLGAARMDALDLLGNGNGSYDLGDMLSWIDRCRRGEADCGGTATDSGPTGGAALPAAARGGGTSRRTVGRARGPRGRSPVRRVRRRVGMPGYLLAVLLAATTAWSCTDGSVGLESPPTAEPGFLTVELAAPAANGAIGVLLELEGPGIETVRASGYELYESGAQEGRRIVVAGQLRPGPLVQFEVPDRNQLSQYRVHVLQVTGEDYGLRDAGEYQVVLRH